MEEKVLAWHFAKSERKLNYGDGREIIVGETHEVEGEIKLCSRGLHASINVLDALSYAPGLILYRVELSGTVLHGDDKLCASHRKYLAQIDATDIVLKFARDCAKDVLHLWNAPEVVVQFLETGDVSLAGAASDAARAAYAARAAAYAAYAAYAAAYAAARAAYAARAAADAAAWAARAAYAASKKAEYNRKLTEIVMNEVTIYSHFHKKGKHNEKVDVQ